MTDPDVAASYQERIERPCEYCGEDQSECAHRTTWEKQSKGFAIKIEDHGDEWRVGAWSRTSGRYLTVDSREDALELAVELIQDLSDVPLEKVDLVARNCSYSREELKGGTRLQRWSE